MNNRGASSAIAIIVLLLGTGLIAGFWFMFNYVTIEIATPTHTMAENWGVNSTSYEQSYSFLLSFNNYMAIIALLLLIIIVVVYVTRRDN